MSDRTLIVGAGPIGLACGLSAKRHGLDPVIIDAGCIVNSIRHYPVAMTFFTTPELLEIGNHPLVCSGAKPTREEALKYYRGIVRTENLNVRSYTRLVSATRHADAIRCTVETRSGTEDIECDRLVLATGYYDNPNTLGVPGEDLPHVSKYFDEAHPWYERDVVVIGGRNSAVEAALELYRAGARTTLVYRGMSFPSSVKYWMKPDIENRVAAGQITAYLGAVVERIDRDAVAVRTSTDRTARIHADRVYALIGYHPDLDLFGRMGIAIDEQTGRPAIDPDTLETNVPGIHMAGSISAGYAISNIFIENGRFDGEKIFGRQPSRIAEGEY
jgi:thioredoxin reductase (NADPH)